MGLFIRFRNVFKKICIKKQKTNFHFFGPPPPPPPEIVQFIMLKKFGGVRGRKYGAYALHAG
jgi:hypothetical protein